MFTNLNRSLSAIALILSLFVGCSSQRADTEIANEIQSKIDGDSNIQTKQVTVSSNAGVVTLSGTVGNQGDLAAAASDAYQVKGVKDVVNKLQVSSAPSTSASSKTTPPVRQKTKSAGTVSRKPSAPASAPAVTKAIPSATIPAGTPISIRLIDPIDSDKNKPGDMFTASVASPVIVEGKTVVPKDADVDGAIQELKSAGHFAGRSAISLALTKLSFKGKTYAIETEEYIQEGSSRGKRTAATVGGGAAVGALIGGLTGGGKGALIGAGVGAGAGTGVQAVTKGQQIHLPAESLLEFRLSAPLTVK